MDEACTARQLLTAAVPCAGTNGDECSTRPSAEGSRVAHLGGGRKPHAQDYNIPARRCPPGRWL